MVELSRPPSTVTYRLRLLPAAPNCVPRVNDCGVTPADSAANDSSVRPATGRSSICFCVMVWLTDAFATCSSGDIPWTVTFSATLASAIVSVGLAISPLRSTKSLTSMGLNPASSTRMM